MDRIHPGPHLKRALRPEMTVRDESNPPERPQIW